MSKRKDPEETGRITVYSGSTMFLPCNCCQACLKEVGEPEIQKMEKSGRKVAEF